MARGIVLAAFEATPEDRRASARLSELADVYFKTDLGSSDLMKVEADADVLVVGGWRGSIGEEDLVRMRNLKLVQTLAAGVNSLPFDSIPASAVVSTGSGANSRQIAEHAFALLLSAGKNILGHTLAMRRGSFPHGEESKVLCGSVLGILGVGSIGTEVARLGRCFGMVVSGCDVVERGGSLLSRFYGSDELNDFLPGLDFLVLSVPLTKTTEGVIGKRELASMKRDAVLVNVCRGKVINEQDLFEHLKENPSFTACLDVWWKYAPGGEFKQDFPFGDLENVLMTPHNASFYPGHHEKMVNVAFDKVFRFLKGEALDGVADPGDYM